MLLSLLILIFIAGSAYRGWRRGLTLEVIEVVGLVAAVLAAVVVGGWLGGALAWMTPLDAGWGWALGGIVVFVAVVVGAGYAAHWTGRHQPPRGRWARILDLAAGGVFSITWSALLATGLLLLFITVPGARARTLEPVCSAPLARVLVGGANPLHSGGERIAELGRPVMLWASQRVFNVFTLAHGEELCGRLAASGGIDQLPRTFRFPPAAPEAIDADAAAERAVLSLVNQTRGRVGLPPLSVDPVLQEVARAHARDMYLRGFFAHETPECGEADGDRPRRRAGPKPPGCTDPFDRMRAGEVRFRVGAENLALAPSAEAAHRGLVASPGHRSNIVNPSFTRAGIGVIRGPFGLMVAELFAG